MRPERDALPAALRLDFSVFYLFRKWSNMWSSHLFRTFLRKVYRPNCQVFQGVQRFSKITALRPVAVSRTIRATSCATPRFFSFLSIFVSGQTCGQATYFERFLEKCTARIVSVVKGSEVRKNLPRKALVGVPNATRYQLRYASIFIKRVHYNR